MIEEGTHMAGMSFYERGRVRIRYAEAGSGFPILLIAGGGLNSTIAGIKGSTPFSFDDLQGEFRVITADLRNSVAGESSGPLEIDRPWDSFADDQLGLMDHLGIDRFIVMGFCINGPFSWNLMKRAPGRVVAAVQAAPVGFRPELPNALYDSQTAGWGTHVSARRPEITREMADTFLNRMFRTNPDFVFTVTRDFVRNCQTPILILPDDSTGHPLAVANEVAMLAPKAEMSIYPWREPKERIPMVARQVRSFLRAHRPASA